MQKEQKWAYFGLGKWHWNWQTCIFFLTHLSRRGMGELIASIPMTPPSICLSVNIPKHFLTGTIKLKFQMGAAGTKFCSNGSGHMIKMATTRINGNTRESILLQNQKADDLQNKYVAFGMWGLPNLFKWWSMLTLTYLTSRSDLLPNVFKLGRWFQSVVVIFNQRLTRYV